MNSNDEIVKNTHVHSKIPSKSSKKSFFSSLNPLNKRPNKSSVNSNSDNKID